MNQSIALLTEARNQSHNNKMNFIHDKLRVNERSHSWLRDSVTWEFWYPIDCDNPNCTNEQTVTANIRALDITESDCTQMVSNVIYWCFFRQRLCPPQEYMPLNGSGVFKHQTHTQARTQFTRICRFRLWSLRRHSSQWTNFAHFTLARESVRPCRVIKLQCSVSPPSCVFLFHFAFSSTKTDFLFCFSLLISCARPALGAVFSSVSCSVYF